MRSLPRLAPALAALVALVLLATGCTGDGDGVDTPARPGESRTDVDTPELRTIKSDAGVEDCPTPVAGATAGKLPALTLACLGGGPDVDLATLRGPMIINIWQAACQACRTEMPVLGAFHRRYGAQVPVLGIDQNDTLPAKALELAGQRDATYPQLADPGGDLLTEAAFARVKGYPFTAFVDADGVIVAQKAGGLKTLDELVDLTQKSLGVELEGPA